MTIVFAENFANDTLDTLPFRYPGSVVFKPVGVTNPPRGISNYGVYWPIYGVWATDLPEFTGTRYEIVMTLTDVAGAAAPGATDYIIFGTFLTWDAARNAHMYGTLPIFGIKTTTTKLHIIAELDGANWKGTVFAHTDGKIIKSKGIIGTTNPLKHNMIGATFGGSLVNANYIVPNFPNWLTSIAVAYDTAPGTMLGDISFEKVVPTVTAPNGWTSTNNDIVGDTDTNDAAKTTPSATGQALEPIEISVATSDLVNWYMAGKANAGSVALKMSLGSASRVQIVERQSAAPKISRVPSLSMEAEPSGQVHSLIDWSQFAPNSFLPKAAKLCHYGAPWSLSMATKGLESNGVANSASLQLVESANPLVKEGLTRGVQYPKLVLPTNNLDAGNLSIEFWAAPPSDSAPLSIRVGADALSSSNNLAAVYLTTSATTNSSQIFSRGGLSNFTYGAFVAGWVFLSLTISNNGNRVRIARNGVEIGTSNSNNGTVPQNLPIVIGGSSNGTISARTVWTTWYIGPIRIRSGAGDHTYMPTALWPRPIV